jgi:hypothetical protein
VLIEDQHQFQDFKNFVKKLLVPTIRLRSRLDGAIAYGEAAEAAIMSRNFDHLVAFTQRYQSNGNRNHSTNKHISNSFFLKTYYLKSFEHCDILQRNDKQCSKSNVLKRQNRSKLFLTF